MAVGGGHRHLPCRIEEAWQGQADREGVQPDHLGVTRAAGSDAFPQGPQQEGFVDQEDVHSVPDGWSVGLMSSAPPAVALRKPQPSRPARKCFLTGLEVASM